MLGAKMGVEMATYNKYLENTVARGARGIPCSLSCGGRRYQLDSIMDQTKQPLQLRKCMPAATLLSGSWHITYNTTGHEWFLLTGKQSAFSKCTCQDFVALPNPDPVHLPQSCCDGLHLPPSCCDVPPCRHAPWHPFRSCHAPCLLGSLCAANVCTFRLKMLKMVMNARLPGVTTALLQALLMMVTLFSYLQKPVTTVCLKVSMRLMRSIA